jgi:hypothetical protein
VNNDYLASCLTLGDNFAMNVEEENTKGMNFNILMCTKTIYILQKPCNMSAWGQKISASDTIVANRYYQKCR